MLRFDAQIQACALLNYVPSGSVISTLKQAHSQDPKDAKLWQVEGHDKGQEQETHSVK
jgi:hypothetical protein